jgi:hypothetical protein
VTHLLILAGSCFPNCHPAGVTGTDPVQQSGSAALGFAAIGLVVLFLLRNKRG